MAETFSISTKTEPKMCLMDLFGISMTIRHATALIYILLYFCSSVLSESQCCKNIECTFTLPCDACLVVYQPDKAKALSHHLLTHEWEHWFDGFTCASREARRGHITIGNYICKISIEDNRFRTVYCHCTYNRCNNHHLDQVKQFIDTNIPFDGQTNNASSQRMNGRSFFSAILGKNAHLFVFFMLFYIYAMWMLRSPPL